MIELKVNEIYIFENSLLKLVKLPFNKNNQEQGLHPILKQLTKEELSLLIINNKLKGGLKLRKWQV